MPPPVLGVVLATWLGASGCLGSYSSFSDGGDPIDPTADGGAQTDPLRARFRREIKPITDQVCASCHDRDGGSGPAILKPDAYDTLKAWPGMITRDPAMSRLVTKGAHAGPAFSGAQLAVILPWLGAEAAVLPPLPSETAPATAPRVPMIGPNSVALDGLAPNLGGARVSFDANYAGASLVLSKLTVRGPTAAGMRVVHPLFIAILDGRKVPDPIDSFSNVDLQVAAGQSATLGPGTLVLNNVGSRDQLSIAFLKISATGVVPTDSGTPTDGGMPPTDGGTVPGGCKAVPTFTTSARPPLVQRCLSCHGGNNAGATGSLDLTRLNDQSMAGQAAACAQVKGRTNVATPSMSAIFTAVAPAGGSTHPYKLPDQNSFSAYQTMIMQWITAEK